MIEKPQIMTVYSITEPEEEIRYFETLIDEYRVSIFAPELGTAIPVSPKRLSEAWERLRALL